MKLHDRLDFVLLFDSKSADSADMFPEIAEPHGKVVVYLRIGVLLPLYDNVFLTFAQ